jgi:hypothetical protein
MRNGKSRGLDRNPHSAMYKKSPRASCSGSLVQAAAGGCLQADPGLHPVAFLATTFV